jgi:poly-beta-hydroxybutyrate-responsive repressor
VARQNGSSNGNAESVHGHPQPKNFLRPCLLLLLGEEPAYGYELREKLAPISLKPWDMGTVYRALNNMEEEGLIASSWERSAEGPRRRRYDVTDSGRLALGLLADEMSGTRDVIGDFLERYREDVGTPATGDPKQPGVLDPF